MFHQFVRLWQNSGLKTSLFAGLIIFSAQAFAAAPIAPTSLLGSATSQSQIGLSWKDNSANEIGFIVQRSLNSGTGFTQIARLGANITNFQDSGLSANTTYYYRIAAYNYSKSRQRYLYSFSNVASVKTLALAPRLQLNGSQFSPGQSISVSVAGTGLNVNEWAALYRASDLDSAWSYQENWMYLNGLKNPPASPVTSTTLQFKAPLEAGTYNIRLFPNTGFENRSAISLNFTVASSVVQPEPVPALTTYSRIFNGVKRTYNHDGATPIVNPSTGLSDLAGLLYNAIEVPNWDITNTGHAPWIQKVMDGTSQVTRFQVFPTDAQLYSWRSQVNQYPFENYKHYVYELEFKLDPSWNFNMPNGDGLLWQAKGHSKPGQYGHAAMGINITGNTLYFSVLYPNSAMRATTWPTSLTWSGNDYVATNFPSRSITSGRYYKIRIETFVDDRPPQFGGQGYVNIYLDGQLWIQHKGPNLHPDQAGPHRFDFGWYNWGGQPSSTRTIYFKKSHLYVK